MIQSGVDADQFTFNSLINAYAKEGKRDKALSIMRLMDAKHVKPGVVTFNTIIDSCARSDYHFRIDACGKNGRLDMAFKLHAQMLSSDSPALRPNSITYSALIDSCLKNRELDKAFQLVQDMHKSKIEMTQVTYTSLLSELSRLRQMEKISQLELWSRGRDPELHLRSSAHVSQAEAKEMTTQAPVLTAPVPLAASDLDGRNQIYELNQSFFTVDRHGEAGDSILIDDDQARYDAWFKQQAFKANMEPTAPIRWAESELPSPFPSSPVTHGSGGAETESDGGSGIKRNSDSISFASSGLTKGNQYFPSALEEYEAMKTSGKLPKADVYRSLIRNIYTESTQRVMREKTGSISSSISSNPATEAALSPLAVPAAQSTLDSSVSVPAASKTASGSTVSMGGSRKEKQKQLREDDLFRFFLVFKEMREAGIVPDSATYNTLINACAGAGDVQRAFEVVEEMQREGVAPDVITYTSLIKACGIQGGLGSVELAEDIFASMQQRTNHFAHTSRPRS